MTRLTTPRKFTILEVSPQCYAELRQALLSHDSRHCIAETGQECIDMSGIAIVNRDVQFAVFQSLRLQATVRSANAVKDQAHVESPEERQYKAEVFHGMP